MVRIISPRANNSCKLIVGPQAEACRTNSKNRARFWTSLRRLRKRQAFTVLIFLVRRFHQPMQFSSRFSVLFHLPRRRLRCAVASRNFQFSKNFRELRSAISVELLREWTTIPKWSHWSCQSRRFYLCYPHVGNAENLGVGPMYGRPSQIRGLQCPLPLQHGGLHNFPRNLPPVFTHYLR